MSHHDALEADLRGRDFIQWTTDTNVFVQAGAGSGKTTTLIQRMLTLLIDDGVDISNLAAITFTEAAAGKLVSDLRAALTQVAHEAVHEPFPGTVTHFRKVTDETEIKRRARAALEGLPGAAIGTLHSFCLRLLKQFPLEAGLPPKVDKVDEMRQQMDASLRADAVVETLTALTNAQAPAAEHVVKLVREYGLQVDTATVAQDLQVLLENGVKLAAIGDAARWMDERWGELEATLAAPRWFADGDADFIRGELALLRSMQRAARAADSGDAAVLALNEYVEKLAPYAEPGMEEEAKLWKPALLKAGNLGSQAKWGGVTAPPDVVAALEERGRDAAEMHPKKLATTLMMEVHGGFERRGRPGLVEALTHITPLLAAMVLDEKDQRVRRGTLEYHDMIFLAKELVTHPENGDIRKLLHEQYSVIFVDEFQDTDPVQYDIVRTIAAGELDAAPTPGSLFMVGDPKQSIYRFRNADIDNYNAVKARYSPAGEVNGDGVLVNLTQNFRSSERVVSAVNTLFHKVFPDVPAIAGEPTQAVYDDMIAQPTATAELPDGSSVQLPGKVVFVYSDEAASGKPAQRYAAEEDDIVAIIRAAVSNTDGAYFSHSPVEQDDGTLTARAFSYSDIAVLVHTHADSRRILKALGNAGIPYVSEGSTLLFLVPEINDVLTVLRAIADPADAFAQVAALRTALIGCSDADLAAGVAGDADPACVKEGRDWLREASKHAAGTDVGATVRSIAAEFNLADAFVAAGREDALGALEQLATMADTFGRVTGLGLREFVRWADDQANSSNGVADPVLDNKVNGVRVMTIHKSKGLEFPMVIVASMSSDYRFKGLPHGLTRSDPRVASLKLSDVTTPDHDLLTEYEEHAAKDEMKRLIYVALTRAESVLAVPLHVGTTSKKELRATKGKALMEAMQLVRAEAEELGTTAELVDAGIALVSRDSLGAPDTSPESGTGGVRVAPEYDFAAAHKDARVAITSASARAPRVGVTAIAHAADQEPGEGVETVPPATAATGLRIHAELETMGWVPAGPFTPVDAGIERTVTGTAFGSAVHEVMEQLAAQARGADSSGGAASVDELSAAAAAMHGVEDPDNAAAASDIARAASAFAASEPFGRATDGRQAFFELPVIGRVGDTAVNGYIDVLYSDSPGPGAVDVAGTGWVIADYKTDSYARPERVASYMLQLETYARILEDALGAKVSRLELIFLDGSKPDGTQVVTHTRHGDARTREVTG